MVVLVVFALAGHPYSRGAAGSYAPTIVIGFVLMMGGLIAAGPWITMVCARLLALRAQRPATLLAGRRLADNPVAAFRSVSGLILAVFVGSVLVGGTATAVASGANGTGAGADADRTAITRPADAAIASRTATTIAGQLTSVEGVHAVTLIYRYPNTDPNGFPQGLVACAALRQTPAVGRCASTTGFAVLPLYTLDIGHSEHGARWPSSHPTPSQLTTSPVEALLVAFDGSAANLEKIRTAVERIALTQLTVPKTLNELSAANVRDVTQLRRMADIAILISVLIAGCSLAVAVAGGLLERKRPFSLLRLTGMPLGVLRRVVLIEAAAPLVGLAMISATCGLLTAALLLRAVRGTTMHLPGSDYYLIITAGLAAALAIVGATMPLLRRISDPESARTE